MKKLISLIIVSTLIIIVLPPIQSQNQDFIYVDVSNSEGPWDGSYLYPYQNITDALLSSEKHDTIYIFKGIYNETIEIDKSVSLIGQEKESTILNGNFIGNVAEIYEENVSIKNLLIRNSGGFSDNSALKINSKNCEIKNCIIYKSKTAIFVNNTENIEIVNNYLQDNGEAILIQNSNTCTIVGNCIHKNAIGIRINRSKKCEIIYTYLHTNGIAVLVDKSENITTNYCKISNNSVNLGGIFTVDSKNLFVNNSMINHNGAGFSIYSTKKLNITNCNICYNTHFAISMRTSSDEILVRNCEINENNRYGFYIEKDNCLEITNNNIEKNKLYGLYSVKADCNARNNYWGSFFGPSFFGIRKASQISFPWIRIKFFPWQTKRIENIGIDSSEIEPYLNCKDYDVPKRTIIFSEQDTDSDKVPDWWEEEFGYNVTDFENHSKLDPDQDGLNNIEECYAYKSGANPFKKDIFLEIDWMKPTNPSESNIPSDKSLNEIIKNFEDNDINLHINLSEELDNIEICTSFAKLRDIYWDYFLHNDLNNPRKGIYHYCVVCNYCPDLNFPFFGWNNLDSFAISADWLKDTFPLKSRDELISGAALHHLGHTLGLTADVFDGIDNVKSARLFSYERIKYKNYKSCMNYFYKYKILDFSDGVHGQGDFNDWKNLNFSFFKDSNFE